ncbi:hypothetical protein BVG16_31640 [Paenibacillus selenitireducens]|uniref:beta-N-acetylhexosaminidase n=1 Tax=Paenibacillus selenitireducens TaxID=1324314 RepID=A0A1T2WZ71_9BACL|nr:glycoside hydrolase family 3 protein [Paenibacillus selenitireducens]OPA72871.1 hypothetical protein BVG16_31640 [Paenibacillus selenitireducens]
MKKTGLWITMLSLCIVVFAAYIYVNQTRVNSQSSTSGKGSAETTQEQRPSPSKPAPPSEDETKQKQELAKNTYIQEKLNQMSLEQKAAQMMIVDMDTLHLRAGEQVPDRIRKQQYGGVILFQRNLESAEKTVRLIHDLKAASDKTPLWVAIDQEGGAVTRLPWMPLYAGNMALGATGNVVDAETTGKFIGEDIKSFGFNLNFAPDLDVNNNPDNPVIGIRSFGSDPAAVSQMGISVMNGLHEAGMPAAVKHFPGHGDTETDSHLGLPSIPYDRERLEQIEWVPFREAIANGVDMIMTAHITYPKLETKTVISKKDGSKIHIPATLSSYFLTDVLRNEMHYDGIIVTDSLEMQAISSNFGDKEAVLMAIQAGADIVLIPPDPEKSIAWIAQSVRNGTLSEQQINQSVERILKLKYTYGLFEADNMLSYEEQWKRAEQRLQDAEARRKEQEVAEHAVTLLNNEDHVLPFQMKSEGKIHVFATAKLLSEVKRQIQTQLKNSKQVISVVGYDLTGALSESKVAQMKASDSILIVTRNLNTDKKQRQAAQQLWKQLKQANKKAAVLSVGAPYDIRYLPDIHAYLAVYGDRKTANLPAGIRAALGIIEPSGKLPVMIPDLRGQTLFEVGEGNTY